MLSVVFRRIFLLRNYNELLLNLVIRDIKVRYKGSFLGVLWAFMEPLLLMVLFTLVFKTIIRFEIPDYPIFILVALLPWGFFSSSLLYSTTSITVNSNLIQKIYFPREVLPLAIIVGRMVHFFLSLLVLIPFIALFGFPVSLAIIYLPLLVFIEFAFIYGISLITSSLNVFFSDVGFLLQFVVNFMFYLIPVFYPVSFVPEEYRALYLLNPMAALIESFRQIFYYGVFPDASYLWTSAMISGLFLWAGYSIFLRLESRFAEIL